mmetsp:Transcript_5318/g.9572  ORF Transcript_5318/g.9572 Transcript_5318/m.9572 type:complete len:97 (+) Transcript_5318:42-332(+)
MHHLAPASRSRAMLVALFSGFLEPACFFGHPSPLQVELVAALSRAGGKQIGMLWLGGSGDVAVLLRFLSPARHEPSTLVWSLCTDQVIHQLSSFGH